MTSAHYEISTVEMLGLWRAGYKVEVCEAILRQSLVAVHASLASHGLACEPGPLAHFYDPRMGLPGRRRARRA